ncbi:MAG: nitronate monooxygenase [Bacteroidetes bacterium]|nr:nitronate monooxygenase [Bacteroidota bacterium]
MENWITRLFDIRYPIIQAGMIWCSGWKLAAAVSNAGGLGLIGSASMNPEILEEHIRKCRAATNKPFGVNVPLMFSYTEEIMKVLIREKIKIVFTSAGNPSLWTPRLKEEGMTVVHVVASLKSARKCAESGVDAIVAEGFEAGGHNGREETTTMTLIPLIRKSVSLPLIAAGGIATGRSMLAAFALGAEGVQMGTRFVMTEESSAHPGFKKRILESKDGDTTLMIKKLAPVRLLRNRFSEAIGQMEAKGASAGELAEFLGKGRAMRGMFEGDLEEGELEIGQVSALLDVIRPAGAVVEEIMKEFNEAKNELTAL